MAKPGLGGRDTKVMMAMLGVRVSTRKLSKDKEFVGGHDHRCIQLGYYGAQPRAAILQLEAASWEFLAKSCPFLIALATDSTESLDKVFRIGVARRPIW